MVKEELPDTAQVDWKGESREFRNAGGAVGGIIIATEDVTDRRGAEAHLRRAHDTFRHLVESSPFGVYVIDADFRLVHVSAGAQKVFELVRPLLGRDLADVLRISRGTGGA